MELIISAHTTVGQLQKQFCTFFPFLKLEVFVDGRTGYVNPNLRRKAPGSLTLNDVTENLKEGPYEFDPSISTTQFERCLQNKGLTVHIFIKSGDAWIKITHTAGMSLQKQNAMGNGQFHSMKANAYTLFL
jgi:hypothetical protein